MFNIVYFQQEIKNLSSIAYKIYNKLLEQNLLSYPIIYTDNYDTVVPNIPIFSTFYLRENFTNKLILSSAKDHIYIPDILKPSTIIVSDTIIPSINCFMQIGADLNIDDSIGIIKERLSYETV